MNHHPHLDALLAKAVSRKLLVWLVASLMLWFGLLPAEQWMILTGVYLGVQGLTDALGARREE